METNSYIHLNFYDRIVVKLNNKNEKIMKEVSARNIFENI